MLAFNSIGWKPSNILFNAVDALLGDPLISSAFNGERPAYAQASIRNTPITAGGNLVVNAESAAQLNAVAGDENVVEAKLDLLFTSAQTTTKTKAAKTGKEKTKTEGYGASGEAGGGILASNKVSSYAKAFIDFTAARGTVTAGGDVSVTAKDTAGIDAQSTVVQDVGRPNDLSGVVDIVNQFLIPGDYDYTTASGAVDLVPGVAFGGTIFGDKVRIGGSYAGGGDTGSVYRYTGSGRVASYVRNGVSLVRTVARPEVKLRRRRRSPHGTILRFVGADATRST